MSFKSQKTEKEVFEKISKHQISDLEKKRVGSRLLVQKEKPFDVVYEDITYESLKILLEKILKNTDYHTVKEHSLNCMDISNKCRNVIPRKVKDWISNILKVSDVLLLHLVQNILEDEVTVFGNQNKERDVYEHLEKVEEFKSVGSSFSAIYDKRNKLEHMQIYSSESGEILIRDMSNKKKMRALEYCINELNQCLPIVIEKFRNEYRDHCL